MEANHLFRNSCSAKSTTKTCPTRVSDFLTKVQMQVVLNILLKVNEIC